MEIDIKNPPEGVRLLVYFNGTVPCICWVDDWAFDFVNAQSPWRASDGHYPYHYPPIIRRRLGGRPTELRLPRLVAAAWLWSQQRPGEPIPADLNCLEVREVLKQSARLIRGRAPLHPWDCRWENWRTGITIELKVKQEDGQYIHKILTAQDYAPESLELRSLPQSDTGDPPLPIQEIVTEKGKQALREVERLSKSGENFDLEFMLGKPQAAPAAKEEGGSSGSDL